MVSRRIFAYRRARAFLVLCMVATLGCQPSGTRFDVVDYGSDRELGRYYQDFSECYYRLDASGAVDIVARRQAANDEGAEVAQVVHLRSVFQPVPGQSPAERTMINALISYMILTPNATESFDGCGFLFCRENREKTELTATLESSSLAPHRSIGIGGQVFTKPRLTGEIRAVRDDRRVVAMLNDLRRVFGPLPNATPPMTDPSIR